MYFYAEELKNVPILSGTIVIPGFIQASLRKIQGNFKDF